MSNFAFYRQPYEDQYTELRQSEGEPYEFKSLIDLDNRDGFVFAPFEPSAECPIILFHNFVAERKNIEDVDLPGIYYSMERADLEKEIYFSDFVKFHKKLEEGLFAKIVLSRKAKLKTSSRIAIEKLFFKACRLYPGMFVSLVSTEKGGDWLMATPEILLKGSSGQWHTMALAGTMKKENKKWSKKDIREQNFVASYIEEAICKFTDSLDKKGPYSYEAGHLVHLRTDFSFRLNYDNRIGSLIEALHPTPAVCGLPKIEARTFILANETSSRRYYSGFAGILSPRAETFLYVTLRCMKVEGDNCELYAGGGLLAESDALCEWEETENKIQTMLSLFE